MLLASHFICVVWIRWTCSPPYCNWNMSNNNNNFANQKNVVKWNAEASYHCQANRMRRNVRRMKRKRKRNLYHQMPYRWNTILLQVGVYQKLSSMSVTCALHARMGLCVCQFSIPTRNNKRKKWKRREKTKLHKYKWRKRGLERDRNGKSSFCWNKMKSNFHIQFTVMQCQSLLEFSLTELLCPTATTTIFPQSFQPMKILDILATFGIQKCNGIRTNTIVLYH